MISGIMRAQKARPVIFRRSASGTLGSAGRSMPRSTQRQARIRPAPMISPGTMPDRNSAEIEVLVVTP